MNDEPGPVLFFNRAKGLSILAGIFALSVLAGILVWDHIRLPFSNPQQVVGPLALIQFNPSNNQLRFMIFLLLPVLSLLAAYSTDLLGLRSLLSAEATGETEEAFANSPGPAGRGWVAVFLLIFSILVSVNIITYFSSQGFDFFHEGESLGAAVSTLHGMKPYQDFWFGHGMVEDPLRSVWAFKLFGRSIGAVRTLQSISKVVAFVFLAVFLIRIFRGNYLYAFLVPLGFYLFQPLGNYDPRKLCGGFEAINPWILASRDAMLFAFLIMIPSWQRFIGQRPMRLPVFCLLSFLFSMLPWAFFAYSVDRAIFITAGYCLLWGCLYFFFLRKHRWHLLFLVLSVLGAAAGLGVFHAAIGGQWGAFGQFVSFMFSKEQELQSSYVFNIRKTQNLIVSLAIAANFFWLVWRFLKILRRQGGSWFLAAETFLKSTLVEAVLFLYAVLFFRSALSRCDWIHVAYVSHLTWILTFYIFVRYYLHPWLSRFTRWMGVTFKCMMFLCAFFSLSLVLRALDQNALDEQFPWRRPDQTYLEPDYHQTLSFFKNTLKPDDYFFTMTSELAWYYLLDKPYPTFFPHVFMASTRKNEERIIEELKGKKIPYVLMDSSRAFNAIDEIEIKDRVPLLWKYVHDRYEYDRQIGSLVIFRQKRRSTL